MNIFLPIIGQFTNVGDVMHRKVLLDWIKQFGTLHLYVGSAPKDFIDSLLLNQDIKVYNNIYYWLFVIIKNIGQRNFFIFNPGEISFSYKRLLYEILLIPFIVLIKLNGKVIRIGIAANGSRVKHLKLWKLIFRFSNLIFWRTFETQRLFGVGEITPDLAFEISKYKNNDSFIRKYLVISMRFDRPFPQQKWFKVIKQFSRKKNLEILVISQVRMDNETTIRIAKEFNSSYILWDDQTNHYEQERTLRQIYQQSYMVISDRLHVLIASVCEGAIPACLLTSPNKKIDNHFKVIGYNDLSINSSGSSEISLSKFLLTQSLRDTELRQSLFNAQEELKNVRKILINNLLTK